MALITSCSKHGLPSNTTALDHLGTSTPPAHRLRPVQHTRTNPHHRGPNHLGLWRERYFNRVHTGYDWNKYNQTHYDHDNPPPKMVQGYKFNVFFPDLIDRTKTPTYVVQPDPEGGQDVCILRIKGGPPYEDIAFKVVNREWETSHKRGFKCRFERGILQLFFNFKRHRYRR